MSAVAVAGADLSLTFGALADPTRRAILDRLALGAATVTELAEPFAMTQQAISKHLKVLERAGLISRSRSAQSRPCQLETGRLDIAADWISRNRKMWQERYDRLDEHLATLRREGPGMTEGGELTYRRVHDAPRELLFDCMTSPGHLTHFWGPAGTITPLDGITVDLRPGGVFETVMVNEADGSTYTMHAVYVEVCRPDRLVWTEPGAGMTTTITFTELADGRTEVVTHQANVPAAYRSPQAQQGFRTSLDRCDAYVASLTSKG